MTEQTDNVGGRSLSSRLRSKGSEQRGTALSYLQSHCFKECMHACKVASVVSNSL